MSKKLTILDIAELSGVGKSTVSRFFNNGYVSESSREKIQKVIGFLLIQYYQKVLLLMKLTLN